MHYQTAGIIYIFVSFFITLFSITLWNKNKAYFDKLLFWTFSLALQQISIFLMIIGQRLPAIIPSVVASGLFLFSVILLIETINSVLKHDTPSRFNYYVFCIAVLISLIAYYAWNIDFIRISIFSLAVVIICLYEFIALSKSNKLNKKKSHLLIFGIIIIIALIFLARVIIYFLGLHNHTHIWESFDFFSIIFSLVGNIFVALGILTIINDKYLHELEIKIINNKKLLKKTTILADTDELTGLSNRRHFYLIAKQEIERSNRYHNPLSLLMIDIDDFKGVNDTYGHDVGDEIIIEVGHTLAKNTRESDVVARWGGDEFIVLLLETGKLEATKIAQKLNKIIAQKSFKHHIQLTVSIGISERIFAESYDSWFKKADNAILKAKEFGKNTVIFCDEVENLKEQLYHLKIGQKYLSGIPLIDKEHLHMIDLLTKMYEGQHTQSDMIALGKDLILYTENHSHDEEAEMLKYAYQGLEEHHAQHIDLIKKAKRIFKEIETHTTDFSATSIAYVMKELIIEHFATQDLDFFEFYKSIH